MVDVGFFKDLGIIAGGAVAGMLVDWGVAMGWNAAGLPKIGVGTLYVDDVLLMLGEGAGAYYMHKAGKTDIRNFLLGMLSMTIATEVGEAIMNMMHPATVSQTVAPTTRYVLA